MSESSRLDQALVSRNLTASRSQAENYIRLGLVRVNGKVITKAGYRVQPGDTISLAAKKQYVSRAGLKLASVAQLLNIDFADKVVLDVGSSTGGFTDYALQHGAQKVIAVDVGTNQLHPKLRTESRVELHEKTDIRAFKPSEHVDIVVIDVSFISLRNILPHIAAITDKGSEVIAMLKPQFEAENSGLKHKGVIKNDAMRRGILKDFEAWVQKLFVVVDKRDSDVTGARGNRERFYVLKTIQR